MSAALLERPASRGCVVVMGDTSDIFEGISDPAVQLALWRRYRPARLDWLDTLDWEEIDDIDAGISGPDFDVSIRQQLYDAGYPETDAGRGLGDDIVDLAARFAQVMGQRDLRLRLEVIETDACRKFHMDYVTARLLMPLCGPGTQWINLRDGVDAPIRQLACGEVGIFKGRLSVGEPTILHRSPPVAGSGDARLLLVLDPVNSKSDGALRL